MEALFDIGAHSGAIPKPLHLPESDWRPPKMEDLPSWVGVKRIGLDTETRDDSIKNKLGPGIRRGGYVVGVSFAFEDGPQFYLPIRHEGGDNLDPDQVLAYLQKNCKEYQGIIVGANLQYDLDYLMEMGVTFHPNVTFRDVQVAEPLLDEYRYSYQLDSLAASYELPGKEEILLKICAEAYGLKNPKEGIWMFAARYVGPYAEYDARLPLQLIRKQEKKLDEQGLWPIYDLESALTPVLVDMIRRGVRIDLTRFDEVHEWLHREEANALKMVNQITGRTIGLGESMKHDIVGPLLEGYYGLKIGRTKKGLFNITNQKLENKNDWLCCALSRARQLDMVRTRFVPSVLDHLTGERLHCSYHSLRGDTDDDEEMRGTTSGRVSSSHPNLQQQPSRHAEIARIWKSIFIPEDGQLWTKRDYSQQEARLLVHYAEKAGLAGATILGDRYRLDPEMDFHDQTAELSGLPRKKAKNAGFGYIYGMSDTRMCVEMGFKTVMGTRYGRKQPVPGEEGQAAIDRFNAGVPFLGGLKTMCKERIASRGYLKTILGRKRRLRKDENGKYEGQHKALNIVIQGSAADQMKMAMLVAYQAGHLLQLQVHDDLPGSVVSYESSREVAEIMEHCVELTVPSKVDVEIGPNWGDTTKMVA